MFYPMLLCIFAGLATTIGGIIVCIKKQISKNTMAFSQGFAAGVMLTISITDLFLHSYNTYTGFFSSLQSLMAVVSLALSGWIIGGLLTKVVVPNEDANEELSINTARRLAVITTAVMVLHNLPEGMLTMFTASNDIKMGIQIALAIALHNLPEGMAIASPVLYATKSPKKALWQTFLAGMAEPIGGIVAFLLLRNFVNDIFITGLMPIIGGIMCQASIKELIPSAIKISNVKHTSYGIITGVLVMSIGIFLI